MVDADMERERHVDELVMQLQPHPRAEAHRAAVFRHIAKTVRHVASGHKQQEEEGGVGLEEEIQVHRFGSVPLKTYLPHGDLDVTAFAADDKWLQKLKEALEAEARQTDAQHVVSGVYSVPHDLNRPAHAEVVKVVKCQIDGISVDVSANALGGLYTLCLLEKVDHLVGDRHLFKRSMVLIKAWCYFESRILSSQNGLLATYALETLVLCIFNMFRPQLSTPISVLAKFLEYFANFDWGNCCLTIRGAVNSADIKRGTVPNAAETEDSTLLLNDSILESDAHLKAIMLGPKEDHRGFQWKNFNICDPLSNTNNLGRSVSRGNALRIRRALMHGWRDLSAVLCDPTSSKGTIHTFYKYTVRTLAGNRPDVGDICIAAHFRNNGTSTPSCRSADFSHSQHSQQSFDTGSTMSRSSGDAEHTMSVSDEEDDKEEMGARRDVEGGNTSLNTALNAILTQPTGHRPEVTEAHEEGGGGVEMIDGVAKSGDSEREGDRSEPSQGERSEGGADGKSEADSCASGGEEEDGVPAGARSSWSMEGDVLAADLEELMGDLQRVEEAMHRLHGPQAISAVTVARSAALAPPPPKADARGRAASPVLADEDFPSLAPKAK